MQESHSTLATAFTSTQMHSVNSLEQLLGSNSFKTTASIVKNTKGQTHLTNQKFRYQSISLCSLNTALSFWSASTMTNDFLGNPFLLYLSVVPCTSTEFLPASCAPCWRGQAFYCLLKQSHRMLCRFQVFSGMSFVLAKVYYHLSKIKTESNMTVSLVRTKPVLVKERHKQTHWPQI